MKTASLLGATAAAALMVLSGSGAAPAATLYANQKAKEPAVNVVQDPASVPAPEPVGKRPPKTHDVVLTTTEVEARLDDGTTYTYL